MSITRAQYEVQVATTEATKLSNINSALTTGKKTLTQALADEEIVKQKTLMVQRDLNRDGGDRSPF